MTVDEAKCLKADLTPLRDHLFDEIADRSQFGLEGDLLLWTLQFCDAAAFVGQVQAQLIAGKLIQDERLHHVRLTSNLVDRLPGLRFRCGHDLEDTLIVHIVQEAARYWQHELEQTAMAGTA